jgi:D-3-phosphoglycerate dehydrogenase
VSEKLLVELIKSGKLSAAALDVFEHEPLPTESPLRALPQVLLTPHLGASTQEAQRKVAEELSQGVIEFYEKGLALHAINLPGFSLDTLEKLGPYLTLSETLGRFLGQMIDSGVRELSCSLHGEFESAHAHPIAVAAVKGVLNVILDQAVSYINAPLLAQDRGIRVSDSMDVHNQEGFSRLISLTAVTDSGIRRVSGTVMARGEPRIVRLGELIVDVKPQGKMIVLTNQDQPGMIGLVGKLLGDRKINIADMRVGRHSPHGEAVMVITVDEDVSTSVLKELASIRGVTGVRWVKL